MKLPTTFQSLDVEGFKIDKNQQYAGVTREMVDIACAVLQKNRVGVVNRSVMAALKTLYGIGGSADTVCKLLQEWRADNLAALKQGKDEKDLVSAILEATDDGLLNDEDIPADYVNACRQMALATYRLAYQKADTSVSGDRMKTLNEENDLLRKQLKDYPQLQMELNFYKSEHERQRTELREAYLSLNKQQLSESEEFRKQLDTLYQERNELFGKLSAAEKRLTELTNLETKERERQGEISRMSGQLEAREREISGLHSQIQSLQAAVGEKQVLESQLAQTMNQLKEANETIVRLQTQQKTSSAELEVDTDLELANRLMQELTKENETLHSQIAKLQSQLEQHSKKTGKMSTANNR